MNEHFFGYIAAISLSWSESSAPTVNPLAHIFISILWTSPPDRSVQLLASWLCWTYVYMWARPWIDRCLVCLAAAIRHRRSEWYHMQSPLEIRVAVCIVPGCVIERNQSSRHALEPSQSPNSASNKTAFVLAKRRISNAKLCKKLEPHCRLGYGWEELWMMQIMMIKLESIIFRWCWRSGWHGCSRVCDSRQCCGVRFALQTKSATQAWGFIIIGVGCFGMAMVIV